LPHGTAAETNVARKLKNLIIGGKHDIEDTSLFHKLSLIAFFAWVGFGADGLSSSCYGPEETFLALGAHLHLSVFVALMSGLTVLIIATSYAQIIELFPTGGGGYLVASKLLSPTAGMVSGSALLIDYVLTITISVASGADALFSFLPPAWMTYKLVFALFGVLLLTVMNMRGVKESVLPLVPIFLTIVVTHAFIIAIYLTCRTIRRAGEHYPGGGGAIACGARHGRHDFPAPARLQHGRGHVHGDRGGEQRPSDTA
jgi:hypothetical protein